MSLLQGNIVERTVYLTMLGTPVPGLTSSQVICKYRKEGAAPTLVTKALTSGTWMDLGGGYYVIQFSAAEMDTVGTFFFKLTSSSFDNFLYDEFDIEPVVAPLPSPIPPGMCIVSGTVKDVGGHIPRDSRISARPVDFPIRAGDNLVNSDAVYTYPDSLGNFTLTLMQGATVIVEIERTAIRSQITVPATPTALLLNLLAPMQQIQ